MSINGAGLLALGMYTGWRFLNFYEQATSNTASKMTAAVDIFYMAVMAYLLVIGSKMFAVIIMISAAMNALLGVAVNMAPVPPDMLENNNRIVANLWLFTLIDVALGGAAYFIMTLWGQV